MRGSRTETDGSTASGNRGQAHTLEAVAAAVILLSAVLFALQVTAVTPLSGSTSNQHIENQQRNVAEGLLEAEAENGSLEDMLLYYNTSSDADRFHGANGDDGEYDGRLPTNTTFGTALQETFLERGIAVNVDLHYIRSGGERRSQPLINLGTPSDHSSTATWQITLRESDELVNSSGCPTEETVADVVAADGCTYFTTNDIESDASGNSDVFNVIEVEVVVWRM
ncbi:hypothetical protein ACFQAS_07175 [Halopenitus salinus]|uniref:Type 4 fimbrial biogenesis protein PilX N-terminal domain-containing protein n=1 Tax=Halopenitus salinus TaxID=1198295 RepID=A0ABD5V2S7_9EURY